MKKDSNNKKTILSYFKNLFKTPKDVISFFIPIIIAIILLIPVPYYVIIGGGVISIDKNIKIDNAYKTKGSFNAAYVSQTKGTISTYLLSKIIKNFELEKIEDVVASNEELEDYKFREKEYFNSSLNNAIYVAYTNANKNIKVKENKLYIVSIINEAQTNLKIQDKILEVDNIKVTNNKEIKDIINKKEVGDNINILVERNNKKVLTTSKLISYQNQKILGISIIQDESYETNPKIKFSFSGKEEGPSGGLMLTLSIYNKLVKEDITKGYKIAGTGTIEKDGTVGEIGGIKYKIQGAVKDKADVFISPSENYEEAKKIIKENKYNIKLIKVHSFTETLEKLNKLN